MAVMLIHDPFDNILRQQFADLLRRCEDPDAKVEGTRVQVHALNAVFEEDRRGLVEVLFQPQPRFPQTAYFRDNELIYITDGW